MMSESGDKGREKRIERDRQTREKKRMVGAMAESPSLTATKETELTLRRGEEQSCNQVQPESQDLNLETATSLPQDLAVGSVDGDDQACQILQHADTRRHVSLQMPLLDRAKISVTSSPEAHTGDTVQYITKTGSSYLGFYIQFSKVWLFLLLQGLDLVFGEWYVISEKPRITEVEPVNPYIFVGDQLVLNCSLHPNYTSDQAFFSRSNDERISDEFVTNITSHILQLNMTMTTVNDSTEYQCRIPGMSIGILGSQAVEVEYYPREVENVSCVVYNWENMICRWSLGVEYKIIGNVEVFLNWTASGTDQFYPCPVGEMTSCEWPEENYTSPFQLNITVRNRKTNITVMKHVTIMAADLVKPDSVENLNSSRVNSTCIELSWNHSKSQNDLLYRVNYTWSQPDGKVVSNFMKTETVTVCRLEPHTEYNFSVEARPSNKGFWSDSIRKSLSTVEDVPAGGPITTSGIYSVGLCSNGLRNTTIYLKAPKKEDQNGILKTYTAEYRRLNSSMWETRTIEVQTTLTLILMCNGDYEVRLYASTRVGRSQTFSRLRISAEGMVPDKLNTVQLKETSQDRTLIIAWNAETCVKYRVFITSFIIKHCVYDDKSTVCKGPVESKVAKNTERRYVVRDLQPGVNHRIWITANSTGGFGKPSDPVFGVPTDKSLTTGAIVGIVFGAVFACVLMIAGFIFCLRWCRRSVFYKMSARLPIDFQIWISDQGVFTPKNTSQMTITNLEYPQCNTRQQPESTEETDCPLSSCAQIAVAQSKSAKDTDCTSLSNTKLTATDSSYSKMAVAADDSSNCIEHEIGIWQAFVNRGFTAGDPDNSDDSSEVSAYVTAGQET